MGGHLKVESLTKYKVQQMQVKIKTSNEAVFSIDCENSTLVLDLKKKIAEHYNGETAVADQRLIFAGKVLKDEETVEFYKLNDGNTIHLVRGGVKKAAPPSSTSPATSATTPAATTPAAPVPNMFGANTASGLPPLSSFTGGPGAMPQMPDMMNNPMFAQMMSQMMANPQMLDMVIQSNPQLAGLITPEMRAQMASPEFQQLVSNPQMLQQMMQMQQMMGGMGGMGGMGAGFNPLANMYGQQVPQQQNPTSNPFLQAMMNNPALAGMGAPNTGSTPAQPPEELYATQLQQLRDMGFYSPQENIRALQMTGGNVEGAVEWLFSRPAGSM